MGRDARPWRKQVKKLQRSRRRKIKAGIQVPEPTQTLKTPPLSDAHGTGESGSSSEASTESDVLLCRIQHDMDEAAFWERERQAQLQFQKRQANRERRRAMKAEQRVKKMADLEAAREKDRILKEEKKAQEELERIQKEEKLNELLDFLSGDIENPPQKFFMPDLLDSDERDSCIYYTRTGACRFFDRCKQAHLQPTLSCILLIQNFFSSFYIEQGLAKSNYNTDLTLEYEESDLYKQFLQFYDDVIPEFKSIGKIVQFKVCNNFEVHMRGNVYVQYDSIRDAVQAYRMFNARFYGGRQLTVQFVKIPSWRGAICGKYCRNRCDKGKTCNYIHPFRNPTKEFMDADNDWPEPSSRHRSHKEKSEERSSRRPKKSSRGESPRSRSAESGSPASSTASDPDKSTPETSPSRGSFSIMPTSTQKDAGKAGISYLEPRITNRKRSSDSERYSEQGSRREGTRKRPSHVRQHRDASSSDEDSPHRKSKRRKEGSKYEQSRQMHSKSFKHSGTSDRSKSESRRHERAEEHSDKDRHRHKTKSTHRSSSSHTSQSDDDGRRRSSHHRKRRDSRDGDEGR